MNKGTPGSGGGGGGGSSGMSSLLGGGAGGLSGMLGGGGGGGGGGKFGTLMNVGMSLLSRGGGGDIGSMLGSLINQSNSGQWKKQTPVLSCNEVEPPLDLNGFSFCLISRVLDLNCPFVKFQASSGDPCRLWWHP